MNIQGTSPTANYYSVRATKNAVNKDRGFLPHLKQSSDTKNRDNTLKEQNIAGKNNTSSHQTSVMIGKMCWNDKELAKVMKEFDNVTININNPINWGTTGEHQLTEEEIDTLKNKYDVTSLSEQDFYNLMADLSHLNAIKPEDIVSKYHFKGPDVPVGSFGFIIPSTKTEKDFQNGGTGRNFLKELNKRVERYFANNDSINSDEFLRLNKYVFDQEQYQHLLMKLKFYAQECYQDANRYFNIVSQLKRNS